MRLTDRVTDRVSEWVDDRVLRPRRLRPWRDAASLADIGELTARWLEGRVLEQPGYYGAVDVDEDQAPGLTAALRTANRAGLWTRSSQAGDVEQLAWVSGRATPGLIHFLDSAARERDDVEVVVFAQLPGEQQTVFGPHQSSTGYVRREHSLVVTWDRGRPFTVDSGGCGEEDIDWLAKWVQPSAVAELRAAVPVAVIDPVPERNSLWAWLGETLLGIQAWPSPRSAHLAPAPVLPAPSVIPRGPVVRTAAGLAVTTGPARRVAQGGRL